MEEFLIYLAQNAGIDRYVNFPARFRTTSQEPDPPTEEEFAKLQNAIKEKDPLTIREITNIDLGIVEHNNNSKIREFEFKYSFLDSYKKNMKYPNRWYLFHGSPIGNWHSILRTGIRNMSGTRFMSSGAAYGNGVYLSDSYSFSAAYAGHTKYKFVAVVEILVDPEPYKKAVNVYVIPDDKLLFPRYLFIADSHSHGHDKNILLYYKKLREGLIKPKIRGKRLAEEEAALQVVGKTDFCLELKHLDCFIYCYIYNFPICSPVFQLKYKLAQPHPKVDESGVLNIDFTEWSPLQNIKDTLDSLTFIRDLKFLPDLNDKF